MLSIIKTKIIWKNLEMAQFYYPLCTIKKTTHTVFSKVLTNIKYYYLPH